MRIFLDTNVLISAMTTRGLCVDVLHLAAGEHEIVLSEIVLAELSRVLQQKFKIPAQRVDEFLRFLRQFHVEPTPDPLPSLSIRDPDDVAVLASAIAGRTDVLVTGDKDFLALPPGEVPIVIMDPRTFWTTFRTSPHG